MKFSRTFFLLTGILFLVEVFIALYVRDSFVRPFMGDVLVVMLIYSFLRTFWANTGTRLILSVCLFAFLVEFSQYFDPVGRLGLEQHRVIAVLWGRTFSWLDLLAYLVGSGFNLRLRHLDG